MKYPSYPPSSCFYIRNAVNTEQPNGTVKKQSKKVKWRIAD